MNRFFSMKSEIKFLGHFLEFETSGKVRIAYYDSPGGFLTYDNGYRSCMMNYLYCFIYSSDFTSSLVSH